MTLVSTLGQLGKWHKDISTLITTPSYLAYLLKLDKQSKGLQKNMIKIFDCHPFANNVFFAKFRFVISENEEFARRLVVHAIIFI